MPAKSGKDGATLKAKYSAFVGRMTGPRTDSAMSKVLSIGITGAKELTPLEYGTLMNSAFRRIEKTGATFRGIAGYTVNYAVYLHNRTDWNPRPPALKSGPAWNPNATPKFLERGFTDPDQLQLMRTAIATEYRKK